MQARQLAEIIAPIVEGLDPAKLYPDGQVPLPKPRAVPPMDPAMLRRIIPDEDEELFDRADLLRIRGEERLALATRPINVREVLKRGGYRWTWRDELGAFVAEVRASPASHALVGIACFFLALALVIAPFAFGWLK
jgi:hypothetical protein